MAWGLTKRLVEAACGLVLIVASVSMVASFFILLLFFVTSFYTWSRGVPAPDAVHPAQRVEHGEVRYITTSQSAAVHGLEVALIATSVPAAVGLLLALGILRLIPSDQWAFRGASAAPARTWKKMRARRRKNEEEDTVKTT
jgi:hypothetical protein